MKGKLVIISAPSGAGKTTIVNHLLEQGLDLEFSISATTRPPRGNEKNGREYWFISADEFTERVNNDEFAEWEEVYKGYRYGTLKSEIERIRNNGMNVIFDVDVKGGIHLKNLYGTEAISIFIMPPSVPELEKRLLGRATDDRERIKTRIEKAKEEIKQSDRFDNIIVNDNLSQAKQEVYQIVKSYLDH
ncbi:MAG: guanylate kinase [Bacteroidales bacterium]|jgi:guanylate kinase|nr:guanylate kinase [Bacteroidales bacterium]